MFPWSGDFFWPGDYYRCKAFQYTEWDGKYCFMNYRVKRDVPTVKKLKLIETITSFFYKYCFQKLLKIGACMPYKCTNEDISKLVNKCI